MSMEKINVITLCSGYDSQCLALKRLKENYSDFDFNLVAWAEFDPESKQPIEKQPAVIAHNALFPEYKDRNMGDMTKCDWSSIKEHIDLLFYSTPCQSLSQCGLQHGMKKGSGTRSSIIWNVLDAIDTLKPKYLVLENVKALVSKKFIKDFNDWQNQLEKRGYINYWNILNSKDFGVPQNRERVFLISVKDDNEKFFFPKKILLNNKLKDILEKEVNEKYYLSDKLINYVYSDGGKNKNYKGAVGVQEGDKISLCVTANYWKTPRQGNYIKEKFSKHLRETIEKCNIPSDSPVYIDAYNRRIKHSVTGAITARIDATNDHYISEPQDLNGYRVRKLTERECFRLMGVNDSDIDKIQATGLSKTQQYKMAGNSIVVDVLYHIFRKMFIEKENESQQLTLF